VSSPANGVRCDRAAATSAYALGALPASEVAELETHLTACDECHAWLVSLRPVVESFAFWPNDILCPSETLQQRLATRISAQARTEPTPAPRAQWIEPEWEQAAPGISCKLLATDAEHDRVSMLVRLDAGAAYPPHTHAGREELHLLEGELWIEDRKLYPGDYNRGEAGTADQRVWSETGCTCVLITSSRDVLGKAADS
jgi:anti-sigma factor ChrR (cupin superfamily)